MMLMMVLLLLLHPVLLGRLLLLLSGNLQRVLVLKYGSQFQLIISDKWNGRLLFICTGVGSSGTLVLLYLLLLLFSFSFTPSIIIVPSPSVLLLLNWLAGWLVWQLLSNIYSLIPIRINCHYPLHMLQKQQEIFLSCFYFFLFLYIPVTPSLCQFFSVYQLTDVGKLKWNYCATSSCSMGEECR